MKINIFSKYYNTPTKNKTATIQGVSQSLWTDSLFGVYKSAFYISFCFFLLSILAERNTQESAVRHKIITFMYEGYLSSDNE